MTQADVEAEHDIALSRLTRQQIRALGRIERAQQLTNFNGRRWQDNLSAIFASEAADRSEPEAGHA